MSPVDNHYRRSVLVGIATGLGTLGLAGAGGERARAGSLQSDGPSVAWRRTYRGGDREYENSIYDVVQSSDGGYALAGTGRPVRETGPEEEQFSLLKADDEGNEQWIAFADDGTEDTRQTAEEVVETPDGGFAVVGHASYPDDPSHGHRAGTDVAEAAKFSAGGDVQWVRTLDAYEEDDSGDDRADPGGEDSAVFLAAAPSNDGDGFVAAGGRDRHAWAAKFAADGSVEWQADHGDLGTFDLAIARDDGSYLLGGTSSGDGHTVYHAVHVDGDGTVRQKVDLDIEYGTVPYNHVLVPSSQGGYALVGRHADREDMVLVKVDENGAQQWLRTYNGPYDGRDWAHDLVQTPDRGYALAGYMSAAYSGEATPTVLKTDADGAEQWRMLDDGSDGREADPLVRTDDGGYAYLGATNELVKLAHEENGQGTATPTPTPTATADGTDTPTETAEGTATDSKTPGGPDMTGTATGGSTATGGGGGTETTAPAEVITDTNTGTAGGGPGFGVLATVGGLASAAAYYLRRGGED